MTLDPKPRGAEAGPVFTMVSHPFYGPAMSSDHITIQHSLGRDKAKERLAQGLGIMRGSFGQYVSKIEEAWPGPYDATLTLSFLGAEASGRASVTDGTIEVSIDQLPIVLRPFKGHVNDYIQKHGPTFFAKAA
jgi:Putative polyhydroxyalkanoic acid system protein (PHA_gran_rgn)